MESKLKEFPLGRLYMLINKSNNRAASVFQMTTLQESKIVTQPPNPQDFKQLWLVQQMKEGQYQIIHASSCNVLQVDDEKIFLNKGAMKSSQLWRLQLSLESQTKYYTIRKQSKNSKKGLVLCGNLILSKQIDLTNDTSFFRFEPVTNNEIMNRTCIIISNHSDKLIDVPEATDKQGTKIIQYDRNLRFNQRWSAIRMGNSYVIENLKSKLNLDILQQKLKVGTEIIQAKSNGELSQRWILEKQPNGMYLIRSAVNSQYCLGIEQHSKKNCANLVLWKASYECIWRIEGFVPI